MRPVFVYRSMAKEWAKGFYRSQAWKAMRKRVLIRDGFTCRICGAVELAMLESKRHPVF